MTKSLVHFGAGNIGRSLAGQLFSHAGWRVTFVDAVPAIIEALNEKGAYDVVVKGDRPANVPERIRVETVCGVSAMDPEAVAQAVAEADLIGTSVGGLVLPKLFPVLAQGIQRRSAPVSILMCENLHGAASIAREGLANELPADFPIDDRVGFVETSIGKMVPIMPTEVRERDPLEVWAEAYNLIIADGEGFVGETPDVPGVVLKENFAAYVDRKLYIHNFGHAVAAYFGHLAGKTFIWECMEDPAIRAATQAAMDQTGRALIHRYPCEFNEANQAEHIEDLLNRFHNKALGDTVFRVGRDLPRKLAPGDCCIGALRLVQEEGGAPDAVCKVIAAALHFKAVDEQGEPFADDRAFLQRVEEQGPAAILREHCGLDPETDADGIKMILAAYTASASAT